MRTAISILVTSEKTTLRITDLRSTGCTTARALHAAQHAMVTQTTPGVETREGKRERDLDAQAGVAFPGLPFHVAVSLVEKHLPDPADLAVLRAVSHGMRSAVDATGLGFRV